MLANALYVASFDSLLYGYTHVSTNLRINSAGVDNLRSLFTKKGETNPLSNGVLSMGGPFCII